VRATRDAIAGLDGVAGDGVVSGCGAEGIVIAVGDGTGAGGYVMVVDIVGDAHRTVVQMCICVSREDASAGYDRAEKRMRSGCAIVTVC
jgi:hypothetical protein